MNKDIEGLHYLSKKLVPLDVMKVYNHFQDSYRTKHLESLLLSLENNTQDDWINRCGDVFLKYINTYFSDEAIVKRELGW